MARQSDRPRAAWVCAVVLTVLGTVGLCSSPAGAQNRFPADAARLLHEAKTLAELSGEDLGYDRPAWQEARSRVLAEPSSQPAGRPWWKWFGRGNSSEPSVDESFE